MLRGKRARQCHKILQSYAGLLDTPTGAQDPHPENKISFRIRILKMLFAHPACMVCWTCGLVSAILILTSSYLSGYPEQIVRVSSRQGLLDARTDFQHSNPEIKLRFRILILKVSFLSPVIKACWTHTNIFSGRES